MDYVEGQALNSYCEDHSLSLDQRLSLFKKVCEAAQHAHQNLVIHRDLKPSNILVTNDGQPRLVDFGVAQDQMLGSLAALNRVRREVTKREVVV